MPKEDSCRNNKFIAVYETIFITSSSRRSAAVQRRNRTVYLYGLARNRSLVFILKTGVDGVRVERRVRPLKWDLVFQRRTSNTLKTEIQGFHCNLGSAR